MDPTTIAQTLAGYAKQPARPYSPTREDLPGLDPTQMPGLGRIPPGLMNALYPPMQPLPPQQSLPSWLPQNVQNYINKAPSYDEGQGQGPRQNIAGGEPYSPTPQIDDIQRLFQNRITQNAPTGDINSIRAQQFRALMKLPGFSGFTGGDNI